MEAVLDDDTIGDHVVLCRDPHDAARDVAVRRRLLQHPERRSRGAIGRLTPSAVGAAAPARPPAMALLGETPKGVLPGDGTKAARDEQLDGRCPVRNQIPRRPPRTWRGLPTAAAGGARLETPEGPPRSPRRVGPQGERYSGQRMALPAGGAADRATLEPPSHGPGTDRARALRRSSRQCPRQRWARSDGWPPQRRPSHRAKVLPRNNLDK